VVVRLQVDAEPVDRDRLDAEGGNVDETVPLGVESQAVALPHAGVVGEPLETPTRHLAGVFAGEQEL
jgi:hypothetical protein